MIETDSGLVPHEVDDLDADTLLAFATDAELQSRRAERRKLNYAARWCVLHPAKTDTGHATWSDAGDRDVLGCDEAIGGEGAPLVAAFAAEPLAAALGISTRAGMQLMADALNLEHRQPLVWGKVQSLGIAPWRARRLAKATASLSLAAARHVDEVLVDRIDSCGPVTIDRAIAEAVARFDPEVLADAEDQDRQSWHVRLSHGAVGGGPGGWAGTSWIDAAGDTTDLTRFHDLVCETAEALKRGGDEDDLDLRKAKALGVIADQLTNPDTPSGPPAPAGDPTTTTTTTGTKRRKRDWTFYVHLDWAQLQAAMADTQADRRASGELGVGAVERLGPATVARIRDWLSGSRRVTIQPVLDMGRGDAVDEHQPPPWMDELVRLRDPHCVFPYCGVGSRDCDLDHVIPYDPGTPAGPRPTRPNQPREPGAAVPATPPLQDRRPLAIRPQPRRHLHLDLTPRTPLPGHPARHLRDPLTCPCSPPCPHFRGFETVASATSSTSGGC
ncbi:MAG: hypothetical protein JWO11_411 [Nocardioides sp.]|nr:hypothetical protein [Nocardioides sp.]